jgi:hypothetical protein
MGLRAAVNNRDLMPFFQKTDGKLGSNESKTSGDKDFHVYLLFMRSDLGTGERSSSGLRDSRGQYINNFPVYPGKSQILELMQPCPVPVRAAKGPRLSSPGPALERMQGDAKMRVCMIHGRDWLPDADLDAYFFANPPSKAFFQCLVCLLQTSWELPKASEQALIRSPHNEYPPKSIRYDTSRCMVVRDGSALSGNGQIIL